MCCVGVVFWVIFYLFVLDLLGFEWGRVVRWGRGEKVWNWVVLLWFLGWVWVGNS